MSESFEEALEKVKECVDGVACWSYTPSGWCKGYEKCGDCKQAARQTIDLIKADHDRELEAARKSSYHEGYADGQRSMDAERRAVAMRLMQLPLDEDSHGNLSQIARAVWHSDFGWTTDACRALRDELVRLMGGVHEPDAALPTYDELEDERQNSACWLQDWDPHNSFDGDGCGEIQIRILYQLLDLGGAMMMDGADAAVAVRDKLIHLLGGDEPTLLKTAAELSQASVDAMSKRAKSCKSVEAIKSGGEYDGKTMENGENHTIATITDELRECVNTATKSYDDTPWHEMDGTTEAEHTICYVTEAELTDIAEHIDAEHAKQCRLLDDSWQATCEQIVKDYDGETAELRAAIVGYKERAAALEESERLRHELAEKVKNQRENLDTLNTMCDFDAIRMLKRERGSYKNRAENAEKHALALERKANALECRLEETHETYCALLNDAVVEYMELYGADAETICRLRNDSLMYRTMLNDAAYQYRDINTERVFACHERDAYLRDLLEGGVPATDENMAEHGWVRLPKDADGEYIHVGDEVCERSGNHFEVMAMKWFGGGLVDGRANWLVYSDEANENTLRSPANITHLRHMRPDPIERLVTQHTLGNLDEQQLIDKLREVMDGKD